MSMCVDCAYARVAAQETHKDTFHENGKLTDTFTKAFDDVNKQFKDHTNFEIDFATARN